ncbi:2-methylcitrate dehydratase PrpD [Mumia flava]|uniref:2-methylcitrate dehydratase PrpD n=1 Tax=Mumia flava TaxID=1348852 RepID=A0A0B2BL20_9ACTN|nr:MmgE/PrpD family protein [Mumia flava]PJJ56337.1 2-methylcitrate dehydratase PrpD [Mumia flava]
MIAEQLAAWVVEAAEIPDDVTATTLAHVLDGLGTAVGARRLDACGPTLTVARGLGGPAEATLLGEATRVGAPAAALASGVMVHALDFDDTHAGGLVHPTAVALPAALAVGEQVGATGREVLDAVTVGLEVACRIGAAAPHAFHRRGLHATMVAGVFASAAVAARLSGLDATTTTDALGIAGSQAGGLLAFLGTGASTKQLHPGLASHAGILAARLAAAGASGPATVLDGPHGLYDALADTTARPSQVVEGLGECWEVRSIGFKPWPTCQLAHATMAAAQAGLFAAGVAGSRVRAVHARVHPDSASVVCAPDRDLAAPASPYAAKFSLPWSVAALVLDGRLGTDTYSETALERADARALAAAVTWEVDAAAVGHAADAPGDVRLRLDDGRTLHGRVERSPGSDGALPARDLHAKLRGNAGPRADEVAAAVAALPLAPDLRGLLRAVARAVEAPDEIPTPDRQEADA